MDQGCQIHGFPVELSGYFYTSTYEKLSAGFEKAVFNEKGNTYCSAFLLGSFHIAYFGTKIEQPWCGQWTDRREEKKRICEIYEISN